MNQIAPSWATTTSLGELNCRPRQSSIRVSRSPFALWIRLIRAGSQRLPCSQTIRAPSRSAAMPLAPFASATSTDTSPGSSSDTRLISTEGERSTPGRGTVVT